VKKFKGVPKSIIENKAEQLAETFVSSEIGFTDEDGMKEGYKQNYMERFMEKIIETL